MKELTGEDIKIGFGQRTKDFREAHKFSQEYTAEMLNTSNQAISKIERGQTFPLPQRIADFANFYKISPRELFDIGFDRRNQKVEMLITAINTYMRKSLSESQLECVLRICEEFANAHN